MDLAIREGLVEELCYNVTSAAVQRQSRISDLRCEGFVAKAAFPRLHC
jgi:hypothetical protein